MAIVTTDDKYYTEIANAIREKALLYNDNYDLADTLDLGYDENWQPITKIPPPKMALAINSFWKNGTHGVGYGSSLFDDESSFFHSPCVDLNGIPYNSSNSTYIDLESPNYGNAYKYTFYIKGDDHHNDYSTNVYAVDLTAPVSGNYLMVYLFKGPDVGGTASSTQRLHINTYTIEYCVGENTETSGDIGHYIDIIVPLDLFYRDKDYATIGSKAVRISRPRIKDRFYAYWA